MDTTETQYTQKEVAEMLQNADDISKQLKKQDKNANIIAGILVIGVGTLAWATKLPVLEAVLCSADSQQPCLFLCGIFFRILMMKKAGEFMVWHRFCLLEYWYHWLIISGVTVLQNGFRVE